MLSKDFELRTSLEDLQTLRDQTIRRVASELSPDQLRRAQNQGKALAEYVHGHDTTIVAASQKQGGLPCIDVRPVGGHNSKEDPTDLLVDFWSGQTHVDRSAYSLKATAGGETSLGSKSSRAMLTRLYLDKERVSDEDFVTFFGQAGADFIQHAADFKKSADKFYASAAGIAFVDQYERRKGTRKVNNPMRRKEVAAAFKATHGYSSAYRYAELLLACLSAQAMSNASATLKSWSFLLGHPEMYVLEAVAGPDGEVLEVLSSRQDSKYSVLADLLGPGLSVTFSNPRGKSTLVATLVRGAVQKSLNLSVWMDGTVQFKV